MRYVTAKKPVKTKHDVHGELKVNVEVPQLDSLDELVSFCGGDDKALDFVNGAIETGAKNAARVALSQSSATDSIEAIEKRARDKSHDYVPGGSGERNYVQRAKAEAFDQLPDLLANAENVSKEDLIAQMKALLAKGA